MTWWHSSVVYQIYPRSFADGNGDGVGDLPGIIEHLDHLQDLGIDVVWLSPVYRSPMDDNGYDISDYDDVDPLFGSLADLDALIAGLHSRGMKLVMDLVVNHTSDAHPWFVDSRDPASDKRDWYVWRPPRPGHTPGTPGAEPTNWASFFSGPAWTFDPASGEYYLHLFSRRQPDLNWENPAVRAEVYAMMRRWVDRGVDGFRMDVINLISKRWPLTDGPVDSPDGLCHDPLHMEGPRLQEFLRELNREVGIDERGLFTVGEMAQVSVQQARAFTDPAAGQLGMVFTFEHMGVDCRGSKWDVIDFRLPVLKASLAAWQYGLADVGWNSLYFENHDQPRSVSRFGDDSPAFRVPCAKTLATSLHLLKGTPYVYQGQELGLANSHFTAITQYDDIESRRFYDDAVGLGADPSALLPVIAARSRDNARTPMQWDASPQAGFTAGTPWLPVNPDHVVVNAEAQVGDPESVFAHYRRLIALRRDLEVVRTGRFELLLPDDERLFCYTRTLGEDRLLVVASWSSVPVGLPLADLPDLAGAEVLLGTHERTGVREHGTTHDPAGVGEQGHTGLAAWESRIYRLH